MSPKPHKSVTISTGHQSVCPVCNELGFESECGYYKIRNPIVLKRMWTHNNPIMRHEVKVNEDMDWGKWKSDISKRRRKFSKKHCSRHNVYTVYCYDCKKVQDEIDEA